MAAQVTFNLISWIWHNARTASYRQTLETAPEILCEVRMQAVKPTNSLPDPETMQ